MQSKTKNNPIKIINAHISLEKEKLQPKRKESIYQKIKILFLRIKLKRQKIQRRYLLKKLIKVLEDVKTWDTEKQKQVVKILQQKKLKNL